MHRLLVMGLLEFIHKVLVDHQIPYFIDGGTLLGACREGTMIEHDDDADIGVWTKHAWRDLLKLTSTFRSSALTLGSQEYKIDVEIHGDCLYKLFIPGLWCQDEEGHIIGTPTLDIFRWREKNGIMELYSMGDRRRFRNCYYKLTELFPLILYPLKTPNDRLISVYGAHDGIPYLKRYYSEDCLEVKRRDIRSKENPLAKLL